MYIVSYNAQHNTRCGLCVAYLWPQIIRCPSRIASRLVWHIASDRHCILVSCHHRFSGICFKSIGIKCLAWGNKSWKLLSVINIIHLLFCSEWAHGIHYMSHKVPIIAHVTSCFFHHVLLFTFLICYLSLNKDVYIKLWQWDFVGKRKCIIKFIHDVEFVCISSDIVRMINWSVAVVRSAEIGYVTTGDSARWLIWREDVARPTVVYTIKSHHSTIDNLFIKIQFNWPL